MCVKFSFLLGGGGGLDRCHCNLFLLPFGCFTLGRGGTIAGKADSCERPLKSEKLPSSLCGKSKLVNFFSGQVKC